MPRNVTTMRTFFFYVDESPHNMTSISSITFNFQTIHSIHSPLERNNKMKSNSIELHAQFGGGSQV